MHNRGGACMAGGHAWQGAHVAGNMHGRGHVCQGAMHDWGGMRGGGVWQGEACMEGGHVWQGGECVAGGGVHGRGACVAGKTEFSAGGTHPTGVHSCCVLISKLYNIRKCCDHFVFGKQLN